MKNENEIRDRLRTLTEECDELVSIAQLNDKLWARVSYIETEIKLLEWVLK